MAKKPRSYFLWVDLFRGGKDGREVTVANSLRDNQLFCTLTVSELSYLSNMVYERYYEKGEPVFRQGDRGFGLYVLSKGRVEIRSQTPQGEVQVAILEKGSFFGELSLIEENNVRSASAVPLESTSLIGFFKPDLMEILARKPSMGVKILLQLSMVLGKRLLETTERIPETVFHEDAA